MILYYDNEDFQYDLLNAVGDFLGEIIIFACDITDKIAERNLLQENEKLLVRALISDYLASKEPFGLKNWNFLFYKEDQMIKITLGTLFDRKMMDLDIREMKVNIW